MVSHGLCNEGLLQDQVGLGKPVLYVAILPLLGRLTHWKPVLPSRSKVSSCPFNCLQREPYIGHIAIGAGVGSPRSQALKGIDDEGKRLEIDSDLLDGLGSRRLIHSRHGQNRLAGIQRLIGQNRLTWGANLWYIVCGQNSNHALHRQRLTRVDPAHLGVRHGAREELGKEHPFRTEVLGVLGCPSDLAHKVGRDKVFSDQFVISHLSFPFALPA